MNAKATIETLIKVGIEVKDAFTKYNLKTGKGWVDYLSSDEAKNSERHLSDLIESLSLDDIRSAVGELQEREKAILKGRRPLELSLDELVQFHAILDVENALVLKEVRAIRSLGFWKWLVDDALPLLVGAGKIVLSLL